jgi:hypothetical protein
MDTTFIQGLLTDIELGVKFWVVFLHDELKKMCTGVCSIPFFEVIFI